MAGKKGGKGDALATFILILAIVVIMAGVFLSQELNHLINWLVH